MTATDARTDPRRASVLLRKYLGPRAGAEALLHAFLAERDLDRDAVRYWIKVYELIAQRKR
jgi:hypothetical protein